MGDDAQKNPDPAESMEKAKSSTRFDSVAPDTTDQEREDQRQAELAEERAEHERRVSGQSDD